MQQSRIYCTGPQTSFTKLCEPCYFQSEYQTVLAMLQESWNWYCGTWKKSCHDLNVDLFIPNVKLY